MSLEHWESYYRSGALASCPTSPAGDLDLEVRQGWLDFFGALPDGARVLDVGTGNGAVALIALEAAHAAGRRFDIHASDLAQIDPVRYVADGQRRLAGIRFHPGVATEQLPFPEGSFDAVSGLYTLEYCDAGRALAEVARVLVNGGQARFVLHHANSLLVTNGQRSLRHAGWVLQETKLFRRLRRFLEAERKRSPAARKAWQELEDSANLIRHGLLEPGPALVLNVTLDAVQKLLNARHRLSPAALELEISRAESDLRASVRRLNDLVSHALDEQGIRLLEAQALEAGLRAMECAEERHAGQNLVGWRMRLTRG